MLSGPIHCYQLEVGSDPKMYLTPTSNMTHVTLLSRAVAQFVIAIGKSELIIQLIRLEWKDYRMLIFNLLCHLTLPVSTCENTRKEGC